MFVSNIRQNGGTNQTLILCGTSHDPREGLWMLRITKSCLPQFLILRKILKIHKNKNANQQKKTINVLSNRKCCKIEQQFKIELEVGREAKRQSPC